MISRCLESVRRSSIYLSSMPGLKLYLNTCVFTACVLHSFLQTPLPKKCVLVTPVSDPHLHQCPHYHPHPTHHYPRPHQLQLYHCEPFLPHPYSCYHQPYTHQAHTCVGYYTDNHGLHNRVNFRWLMIMHTCGLVFRSSRFLPCFTSLVTFTSIFSDFVL